jgi:hypothetical protein
MKKPREGEPSRGRTTSLVSTSVIKALWLLRNRSGYAQIVGRGFSGSAIGHNLEGNLLAFAEGVQSGALYRADVHEHILATVIRLDESETLLAIEPLHGSLRHKTYLS